MLFIVKSLFYFNIWLFVFPRFEGSRVSCDLAFDIFDCVSDRITEYCSKHHFHDEHHVKGHHPSHSEHVIDEHYTHFDEDTSYHDDDTYYY